MEPRDQKVVRAIGRNLAAERARAGLTQEEVADRMDVQVTQYARLEQGATDSGISKYVRAARAIGTPFERMFVDLELDRA